jgi:nitrogen fixation/metabolism regulation signal transduction histidine kinase
MAFKRHSLILMALLILLVITSVGLGWCLLSTRLHLAILLGITVLLEVGLVYRLLTRTHREILFFFKALENEDTSIRYGSDYRNRIIDELHNYMDALNQGFRRIQVNSERREQYFSRILENLSSGLLVASKTGHIQHVNQEALHLLNVPNLTHLKALSEVSQALYQKVRGMHSLEKVEITHQDRPGSRKVLGIQMVEINLKGEDLQVYTLNDLSAGMERKEIEDWIRLIRVMSHEIMNSLAPITSISSTLKEVWTERIKDSGSDEDTEARIRQTVKGMDAIAEQSEGLTTFFESYRVLSRIPDPVKKEFGVCGLLDKLETLVRSDETNAGIQFSFYCEDHEMKLLADEQMIHNVLLNLVKNASQAVEGTQDPAIHVSARQNGPQVIIEVSDNGPGIPAEIADEIFMPFFTTRKKGTGVGLSYSRQVVNMNGGRIEFTSGPGHTVFRLVF